MGGGASKNKSSGVLGFIRDKLGGADKGEKRPSSRSDSVSKLQSNTL